MSVLDLPAVSLTLMDSTISPIGRYWGKARAAQDGGWAFHLLPYHCLDVAAVAEAWWNLDVPLRKAMVRSCGVDETPLKAWLLFFCALHDFGKLDVRFQLKRPEVARMLHAGFMDADHGAASRYDHGQGGYAAFVREVEGQGDEAREWMRLVVSHHGDFVSDAQWRSPAASPATKAFDKNARAAWVEFLADFFLKPAGVDLKRMPLPPPHLAGFCCVCDWLGSNGDFFQYDSVRRDLKEYCASRSDVAMRCLEGNGLVRVAAGQAGMAHVFPRLEPRGVQRLVEDWPLRPGLTLIEAPTGSGKTEAALAYASRLLAASLADGIIFALPTQATANAMLGRLEAAAGRLFEGGANIVLAHGRARYNADFMRLQEAGPRVAQEQGDASAQCARWLASSRKKVFLGQIGVCTVDQVLLSVLPIKHQFLRSFGVNKSVLIVDEIHAYDGYMNGLLDEVLKRQKLAGGSAILLSATLDAVRRRQLMRLWAGGACQEAVVAGGLEPYPLVTRVEGSGCGLWRLDEQEPERRVTFDLRPSAGLKITDDVLENLKQAARAGARAVLICNLVADAQDAARRLLALGVPVDLFHSRYRFCDRQAMESRVLQAYGKDGVSNGGRVLVATQVVEQSLDLDFDWMVTQLCPADLLFQRLGRLHRHERRRPEEFRNPRCAVIVPDTLDFGGHKYIYSNLRALWRTQQLVEKSGAAVFPAAYREWIEAVYAEDPWPGEPREIVDAFERFSEEEDASRFCAKQLVGSGMSEYNDTDGNVTALTRDGEMAASVLPLVAEGGRHLFLDGGTLSPQDEDFDEQVDLNSVPVPPGWAKDITEDEARRRLLIMKQASEGRWEARAGGSQWSYDKRIGLERRKA